MTYNNTKRTWPQTDGALTVCDQIDQGHSLKCLSCVFVLK